MTKEKEKTTAAEVAQAAQAAPLQPLPHSGEGEITGSPTPAEVGRAQNQTAAGSAAPGGGVTTGGTSPTLEKPNVAESADPNGVAAKVAASGAQGGATTSGAQDGTQDGTAGSVAPDGATDEDKQLNVVHGPDGKPILDADGKPMTYGAGGHLTNAQLYEILSRPQELSPEEKKKEKRQKLFAAISDGISALSNLYFTTKGAPNMYSGKNTQSEKMATYWDKLLKDRESNRKRYVDGYLKATQADSLEAIRKQNADTAQAAKEAEAKRKETEAKRKDDLAEAQGEVYRARAAKDAAATAMAEKTLEYMNTYGWPLKRAKAQADIDLAKARTTQSEASADKASASAAKARASAGGSGGNKYYGTFNGVSYKTKADYDKAVVDYAKGNKIPLTYNKESTDKYGRKRTTQTNRTVPGLAAAGEKVQREKQEAAAKQAAAKKAAVKAPAEGGRAQNGARAGAKPAAAAKPAQRTYTHTKSLGL